LRTSASHRLSFPRVFLSLAISAASLLGCRAGAAPAETAKESWTGLYFSGKKIGYTSTITESTTFRGRPALKVTSASKTRIELFGNNVAQDTTSVTYVDPSYKPLYQEYAIASNGSAVKIKADYQPGKIVCTVNSGGTPVQKEVPIPPGANIAVDSSDVVQGQKISPGQKMTLYFLEPLSISLLKADITVQAEEQVMLEGVKYQALRVVAATPMGVMTSWETTTGDLLKGDMALGPISLSMYRESKVTAQNTGSAAPRFAVIGAGGATKAAYVPPKDFALATSVTTDRPIENPRSVRSLTVAVAGVEDPRLIVSDKRQRATASGDSEHTVNMRITAEMFDPARAATLPITKPSVQAQLKGAPYLEIDDPQIRALAADIKGDETNSYKIAVKIRDWVHAHMTPDYSIGVPRSCAEINGKRRGVCRDYATLYAGIARAAGIPTRVCGGIVYADGRFFYHAWAESWVGDWVAFDPTLKADFVDATHIKFAQGDITDMFRVAGVVGHIKVKVLAVD